MAVGKAWMLMIGLSATDLSPEASIHTDRASCETAARVINAQAEKAATELRASCREIEFIELEELEGKVQPLHKSPPLEMVDPAAPVKPKRGGTTATS